MPTVAPYSIILHGTNVDVACDSSSETAVAVVEGASGHVEQATTCYTIYPLFTRENEVRKGGGGVKINSTSTYKSYEIVTARYTNLTGDVADMTGIFNDIFAVINKNYTWLEVITYKQTLHTAGKFIKVSIEVGEPVPVAGKVFIELKLTKVKPE